MCASLRALNPVTDEGGATQPFLSDLPPSCTGSNDEFPSAADTTEMVVCPEDGCRGGAITETRAASGGAGTGAGAGAQTEANPARAPTTYALCERNLPSLPLSDTTPPHVMEAALDILGQTTTTSYPEFLTLQFCKQVR